MLRILPHPQPLTSRAETAPEERQWDPAHGRVLSQEDRKAGAGDENARELSRHE